MRSPSLVGRTLGGRYQLRERLGEGGWGVVYAATQLDLGRPVAVKVLHTNVALASDGLARFEREARAAAALGHPNIAQVTDFQVNPGEPPFLVMELLTGQTLGAVLGTGGRLAPGRVVWIAHQILTALDAAHRAGMIHRDVKPDNVFLVSVPGLEDHVKLLDFGIAKLSGDTQQGAAQLTGDGAMLGSPAYMAPEQIRGVGVDHRVDLYAVGATMYRAIAGRMPFEATAIHGLLLAITEQKAVPLVELDPTVDPALSAFVDRALHKDPMGRFPSAAAMRDALAPFLAPGVRSVVSHAPLAALTSPSAGPPTAEVGIGPTPMAMAHGGPYGSPPTPHHGMQTSPLGVTSPASPPVMTPGGYGMTPPAPSPPYGVPPPSPPMAQAQPVAAPAAKSGGGAIVALLVVIVLLLLALIGGVIGVFFFLRSPAPAPVAATTAVTTVATAPPPSTAATPAAPSAIAAAATTSAPAVPGGGATTPPKGKPVPAGPNVADAGVLPAPTAPPPPSPPGKKEYGGASNVYCSGGSFNKHDIAASRAAIDKVMPQIRGCYAATQYDPPDHQFNYYRITIDAGGNVTNVGTVTEASSHPKLNPCLFAALRQAKFQPIAGTIDVGFTARTKDNP